MWQVLEQTYTIEAINKCLPNFDVTPPLAFIIKSIHPRHIRTFVISSQQEKVLWILDLVAHKKEDSLQRMFSSIHVIAQEEKIRTRWKSAHFEHSDKVRVLPVNVTHDFDWRFQLDKGWLIKEYLPHPRTNRIDLRVSQTNSLCTFPSVSSIQKSFDVVVNIRILQFSHCHCK